MGYSYKFMHLIAVIIILFAVTVNFTKAPPKTSYPEATHQSELIASNAITVMADNKRLKRQCTCPTEIEKMDCDDGLCSVAIIGLDNGQNYRSTTSNLTGQKSLVRTYADSPDPFPPRPTL